MNIKDFIGNYKNHPVLFIGTGFSLRYLKNSYTWDGLLSRIAFDLKGNKEFYLDIKSKHQKDDGKYDFENIATDLEKIFNDNLENDRHGKFSEINNIFYANMENSINLSRFKIYISEIFSILEFKQEAEEEINELRKISRNISSIITTNYDKLLEEVFKFRPLIGNNILLSNPYGAVYKIHGCISDIETIIITSKDYEKFNSKYELIRAQLVSLFVHNPIIFIGYSINDENIKNILKTIFSYIEPNTDDAEKIRNNFLLVEYQEGSISEDIAEHDIEIKEGHTIRINKIKTDNYKLIYTVLADLQLPISAMDLMKVQGVLKEIQSGGKIKVHFTEDWESIENGDKVIAFGSSKTIKYHYEKPAEMMANYFDSIDNKKVELLTLIDTYNIRKSDYFPIFGFLTINPSIKNTTYLKEIQRKKINALTNFNNNHNTIIAIKNDNKISKTNKNSAIIYSILNNNINLNEVETYLRQYDTAKKKDTEYKKLLCVFDLKKYG